MTDSMWTGNNLNGDYIDLSNWKSGIPGPSDTAFFGASPTAYIFVESFNQQIGQWEFLPGASQYTFIVTYGGNPGDLEFVGTGITIIGGSAHIIDYFKVVFNNSSSAGTATFDVYNRLEFDNSSSADNSTITIQPRGTLVFRNNSTGDNAQLIAEAGGVVDFSPSTGPFGFNTITAGSIAGAGSFFLGGDELFVGSSGLSTTVSGLIADGSKGGGGGSGAVLVKRGPGTLTLSHAGNTYSGGTYVQGGTLDLAAVGAAGTGFVQCTQPATVKIENQAMSGRVFANPIGFELGIKSIIDLAGLKFHPGATAKYHPAGHHLTVHSGHVTDTLILEPSFLVGAHFHASSDRHGGTKVTVVTPATIQHAVASPDLHGWDAAQSTADLADSYFASQPGDFLITA